MDAQQWLRAMQYDMESIATVSATKPHGKKADIEVRMVIGGEVRIEGISLKLVSNPRGFNQIDKRWLKDYDDMWNFPDDVRMALQLFTGETAPGVPSRDPRRLFLDEMNATTQEAVVKFFSDQRVQIVTDLFKGEGEHSAGWILVTLKAPADRDVSDPPTCRWVLRSMDEAIRFYSQGEVKITAAGNLKIGRITVQRKGGDNGRDTANMLQFKINPVELFSIDGPIDSK